MNTFIHRLAANWQSGITIALLSLPFSVSLAVASQTTPIAGIITSIWTGLIGSLFGGSNYNIIGVTGALSGLLATYALTHGSASLASLAIVTGCFIFIGYLLRLERYLIFIPGAVIHGFTLGVALIIGLSQITNALGLKGLTPHHHFINNVREAITHLDTYSLPVVLLFLVFTSFLSILTHLKPTIPWVIVLTPVGILVGYLSTIDYLPTVPTLGMKFGTITPKLFQFPSFFFDFSLLSTGMIIAVVAILETMIAARIGDGLTKTKHNKRKEMFGLGLANIASGIMGGIPATAAIGRTIFNIKIGARDSLSATISSVTMATIAMLFLTYFTYAPMALIAAILVHTALRLIEREHFTHMFAIDRTNFTLSLLVAMVTVIIDPIIGILFGSAVAFILLLSRGYYSSRNNSDYATIKSERHTHQMLIYSFKGQLTYINGQAHVARFESNMPHTTTIILDVDNLHFIDVDGADALTEIIDLVHGQGKKVIITNRSSYLHHFLEKMPAYTRLAKNGCVFATTEEAIAAIST